MFFTTAVMAVAGFFVAPQVQAKTACCVYYEGAAKSNQCYDIALMPAPNTGFECSTEADPTKKYSINLSGAYTVDMSIEDSCVAVPGYLLENAFPSDAQCVKGKEVKTNKWLNALADAKVAAAEASTKQAAQGFCCIAVGKVGSCSTPTLQPTVLKSVRDGIFDPAKPYIISLPKNASDKKGYNLYKYFVCPSGTEYYHASCSDTTPLPEDDAKKFIGGAANLNNYSLANYCAIKDQVPYYCSCKTDGTVCFDNKYQSKEECLKSSPNSSYECLGLEKGKTQCKDLLKKTDNKVDYKPPDTGIPFSVPAIDDLNKLGTTDVSLIIGRAVKSALGIIGTIAFALFVYAGILWMVSVGNSERIGKAKDILVWTSLGIAVIFASYAIVDIIFKAFQ